MMRIAWLSAPQRLVTLRRASAGLLLGLAPLALITLGVIAIFVPPTFNIEIVLIAQIGLVLLGAALAILPLLLWTRTRALGAGLAIGFLLSCALLAYILATTDFTGFFV